MKKTNALLRVAWIGLAITLVLNLLAIFVFHKGAAVFFTEQWWFSWFPSWVVWIVLTIAGLGARRHSKPAG
jgi:hypothetical protein